MVEMNIDKREKKGKVGMKMRKDMVKNENLKIMVKNIREEEDN